jgi:iron complex transport system substrate-binding protein
VSKPRIVSLLPSATEIVCLLGLEQQLVGVTHECDFPDSVRALPKVTRSRIPATASSHEIDSLVREQLDTRAALYTLDMPLLERLGPDVIVTQALCDVCAVSDEEVRFAADSLPSRPRVINLEPNRLEDVLTCIQRVGEATGRTPQADLAVQSLRRRIDTVADRSARLDIRPRTLLLEWIDPPFSSGHWNPELVWLAGGRELIGRAGRRSRTIDWERVREVDPEVMIVACCGFAIERTVADLPILRGYPGWESLACVKSRRVHAVDGSSYFNRPGPRLVDSLEILAHLLHPDVHSDLWPY